MAGLSVALLCLVPVFLTQSTAKSLFTDALQEKFFFDLFAWICGAWLFSFVSAICGWTGMARLGQWLGIILLSVGQAILIFLWIDFSNYENFFHGLLWITPLLLQLTFLGYFFGLFTMPALALSGSKRLTGLGTLAVLLPWVLGRDVIVAGTHFLNGQVL